MGTTIRKSTSFGKWVAVICAMLMSATATADPVWHCSRSDVKVADASDNFTLAALDEHEIMRISMVDLFTIYQGSLIKVGRHEMSACFVGGDDATTAKAMKSIGVEISALHAISRRSSLAPNRLHMVRDEKSMMACIKKNHPAIGYLSKATHTEAAAPCF